MKLRSALVLFLLGIFIVTLPMVSQGDPFGAQTISTRFGLLSITYNQDDFECKILQGKAKIYYEDGYRCYFLTKFELENSDALLIGFWDGGSGTWETYRIITLEKNGAKFSDEFGSTDASILSDDNAKFVQKKVNRNGSKLVFDLGFDNGKVNQAVYENENITTQLLKPSKITPLSGEDCKFLYEDIYLKCYCEGEDLGLNEGMGAVRDWGSIEHNPAYQKAKFQELCEQDCKTKPMKGVTYRKFKKAVCQTP